MPIQFRRDAWKSDQQWDQMRQIEQEFALLKQLLISRVVETVTTTQKNAIDNPGQRIVFDSTLGKLCFYNGSAWETITSV